MRRDELPSKEKTTREILELIKQRADQGRDLWETYEDYFSAVRELDDHKENRELLERLSKTLSKEFDKDIFETWRHSLLFAAQLYRLMFRHERDLNVLDQWADQVLDGCMWSESAVEDYRNYIK